MQQWEEKWRNFANKLVHCSFTYHLCLQLSLQTNTLKQANSTKQKKALFPNLKTNFSIFDIIKNKIADPRPPYAKLNHKTNKLLNTPYTKLNSLEEHTFKPKQKSNKNQELKQG